ncbi:MAG TPA: fatty acid--CoA ligase family protein [Planctomycetota bacterium]|nr:fatty acid--CoA ligase family protein [Planctomycetota bacterium]
MQSPVVDAFATLLRANPAGPVAWTATGSRDRQSLAALADQISTLLAGTPSHGRIAISVRDGFLFLAAVLATWRHGSCAILLDAADPQAPRLDLARQFGAGSLLHLDSELRCERVGAPAPANDLAAIKLTSGTTGWPRAVGVGFPELIADAEALEHSMGIGPGDRVLAAVPMSFSYGVGNLLVPALSCGRELVLPDTSHPVGLMHALRHGAPTVLPAVPALLRALLRSTFDLPSSLRLVLSAGAALAPDDALAFHRRFHHHVHAFYGATEAGGICYDRTGLAAERGTVGTPVDGVAVTLDANGCVRVKSKAVGRALHPDPALRDGVFTTTDLGEWRGGELYLSGNASGVFDVGGHKVHPGEVERVIAAVPGVVDVVVVPWLDEHGRASCAALVAAAVDEAAVRRHCVQKLPAAKVPRCIVVVPELPRSSRGKLQRDDVERLLGIARPDRSGSAT